MWVPEDDTLLLQQLSQLHSNFWTMAVFSFRSSCEMVLPLRLKKSLIIESYMNFWSDLSVRGLVRFIDSRSTFGRCNSTS